MQVTETTVAPAAPPPSAYPDPISLPVAPHGDPWAAVLLAAAYRHFAEELDAMGRRVEGLAGDLEGRWRGQGSSALAVAASAVHSDARTLAAACRTAADHLDDYAAALKKAQHHHGWSIGKFVAIGAIVAVTTVAVVVTVGAAAPVGTVAALEVGEAIAGTEAAVGAATAAETAATTGLSLAGQAMTTLRGLTALALPHLGQGAICATIDVGFHLATGRHITPVDLGEAFAAGTMGSATTAATSNALRASETWKGVGTLGQAALDTGALTATLSADQALQEYASTGHVDPSELTRDALLTALTGGMSALRNPVRAPGIAMPAKAKPPIKIRPVDAPPAAGVPPEQINGGPGNLWQHEGPHWPWGHTIQKHVGQSIHDLRVRLATDTHLNAVSTFTDQATAERAILDVMRQHPTDYSALLAGKEDSLKLEGDVGYDCGTVLPRHGAPYAGHRVVVVLVAINERSLSGQRMWDDMNERDRLQRQYRYLDAMLGFYFGQDCFDPWPDEASTMAQYMRSNDEERRRATLDELLELRRVTANDAKMDHAMKTINPWYGPDGGNYPLAEFADRLIAYIQASLPDDGPVDA